MEVNKKRWLCGGTAAALALALAVAGIVCWFRTNRVPCLLYTSPSPRD